MAENKEDKDNLHLKVESDFADVSQTKEQQKACSLIRDKARELAHVIVDLLPICREQTTALKRVEEAVAEATAGVIQPHN